MSIWNFSSKKIMLSHLIGKEFGDNPVDRMNEIRKTKIELASSIYTKISPAPDSEIIEIGSGIGIMAEWMSHRVSKLHCCDLSESFLEVAQEECQGRENISFHILKDCNLSFANDNSIDAIYSNNVFIHLNLYDIVMYFKEFQRVLKSGGRVWFDIANSECFDNGLPDLFFEMLGYYEKSHKDVALLINYNSPNAIVGIAKSFGFSAEILSEAGSENLAMLFTKNK